MKKLLSVVLVFAMVLVFSGFTAPKTALDYYKDIEVAMEKVSSVTGRVVGTVEASVPGESVKIDMDISYQQVIRSATDVDMAMLIKMEAFGETIELTAIYKDGYIYMTESESGENVKMYVDMDEALALVGAMDLSYSEDMILRTAVKEEDGGDRLVTIILDNKIVRDYIRQYMYFIMGSSISGMKIDMDNISYSVRIGSDDLPKQDRVKFGLNIEVDGEAVALAVDMTSYYYAYNTVEAINAPANADSYTEL